MASYSYYKDNKWIDIKAKDINQVRAKIIKKFGTNIGEVWIARNDVMVGAIRYSKTKHRFEWGDNHIPYGKIIPESGRFVSDD